MEKALIAASSTPLILSILEEGESYGYAIIHRIREISNGEIEWSEGMLYPVLHRLEKQGLLASSWAVGANGRRRKLYRLQKPGQQALKTQRAQWDLVDSALRQLWEGG